MTILEMQKEVYQNKIEKGFNVTDINREFCLLYGEVAEAFEAWRKHLPSVGEELADIAIYLMGISEILEIDLQREIETKIRINRGRKYNVIDGVLQEIKEK